MNYWGRGVPDWLALAKEVLSRDTALLLKYPGLQPILESLGVRELRVEGLGYGIEWVFRGVSSIRVNGGGLLSEEPLEPSTNVVAPLHPISPWKGVSGLVENMPATGRSTGRGVYFLNILGWKPLLPVFCEDDCVYYPPSCRGMNGLSAGMISAPSLGVEEASSRCLTKGSLESIEEIVLGGWLILGIKGKASRGPVVTVVDAGDLGLAVTRWTLLAVGEGVIDVLHGMLDPEVFLLFPLHYRNMGRVREGLDVRALSVVVRGPRGSFSLSSPSGVEASFNRGAIRASFKGSLAVVVGGEAQAYRSLVEQTIKWEPLEMANTGLGHVRSGTASPVIIDADSQRIVMSVSNPTSQDSVVEVLLRFPVDLVETESMLGKASFKPSRGEFRIPAPSSFAGTVKVHVKKPLQLFLRRRGL